MGGNSSKYKIAVGDGRSTLLSDNQVEWMASPQQKVLPIKYDSFSVCGNLGKGKFGFVFLCKHHSSSKHVAIKYISKDAIFENRSLIRIQQEASINQSMDHPFIIHCFGGFETSACIAFVFEFALGGELYTHLKKRKGGTLTENEAKFYFVELTLALHYLHDTLGVIYRDLKPENILIDSGGHVKLCDFGFAVVCEVETKDCTVGDTAVGLSDGCGTAMYIAPEIAGGFMKRQHGYPVDWWSLGCVLYEMIAGRAPFGDTDTMSKFEIFNNINSKAVSIPYSYSTNRPLKSMIKGLLDKDPDKRFNWTTIKTCSWCNDVVWEDFMKFKVCPPWIPKYSSLPDTSNFVKWSFDIPAVVSPSANSYCAGFVLPRNRSRSSSTSNLVSTSTSTISGQHQSTPSRPQQSNSEDDQDRDGSARPLGTVAGRKSSSASLTRRKSEVGSLTTQSSSRALPLKRDKTRKSSSAL